MKKELFVVMMLLVSMLMPLSAYADDFSERPIEYIPKEPDEPKKEITPLPDKLPSMDVKPREQKEYNLQIGRSKEKREFIEQTQIHQQSSDTIRLSYGKTFVDISITGKLDPRSIESVDKVSGLSTKISTLDMNYKWEYVFRLPSETFTPIIEVKSNQDAKLIDGKTVIDDIQVSFDDVLQHNFTYKTKQTSSNTVEYLLSKDWVSEGYSTDDIVVIDPIIELHTPSTEIEDDTFVDDLSSSSNFGSRYYMDSYDGASWTEISYIKFNISSFPDTSDYVTSASLNLYTATGYDSCTFPKLFDSYVYELHDNSWDEGSVTWNTRPSTSDYGINTSEELFITDYDYFWVEYDVTDMLRNATGDGNNSISFAIESDGLIEMKTKERSVASERPYLNISYTSATGNNEPEYSIPVPSNNSVDISPLGTTSIDVSDPEGDEMIVSFYYNDSGTWYNYYTSNWTRNGTVTTDAVQNFSGYDTTYEWKVNITDGIDYNNSETYTFTTIGNSDPVLSNPSYTPTKGVWNYDIFTFNVTYSSADGDLPEPGILLHLTTDDSDWELYEWMEYKSGDNTTGANYEWSGTLPYGNITYVMSVGDAYYEIIYELDDLNITESNRDKEFALIRDINATPTHDWTGGFEPIGYEPALPNWDFGGHFYGNGYTIDNLYINRPTVDGFGFFMGTDPGTEIHNLHLTNVDITGDNYISGLADYVQGNVENCSVTGSVTSNGDAIGGLFVRMYDTTTNNTFAQVDLTTSGDYAGGYSAFEVLHTSSYINNSYSTGSVPSVTYPGGFMGNFSSPTATVNRSYWDTESSGIATTGGNATGYTTAQMKDISNFHGWDFTNTWEQLTPTSYPTLRATDDDNVTGIARLTRSGPESVEPSFSIEFPTFIRSGDYIEGTGFIKDENDNPITEYTSHTRIYNETNTLIIGPIEWHCNDGNYQTTISSTSLLPGIYTIEVNFTQSGTYIFNTTETLYISYDAPPGIYSDAIVSFSYYNTNEGLGLPLETLKLYVDGDRLIGNTYNGYIGENITVTVRDYYNTTMYEDNLTINNSYYFIDLGLTFHSWLFGNSNEEYYMISLLREGGSRWWERGIVPYGEREFLIPSGNYTLRIYDGDYNEIYNSTTPPSIEVNNSRVYVISGTNLSEVISGQSVIRGQLLELQSELSDATRPKLVKEMNNLPFVYNVLQCEGSILETELICPYQAVTATTTNISYANQTMECLIPDNDTADGSIYVKDDMLYISGPSATTWVNITNDGDYTNYTYIPNRVEISGGNVTINASHNITITRVTTYQQILEFYWTKYTETLRYTSTNDVTNYLNATITDVYVTIQYANDTIPLYNTVTVNDVTNGELLTAGENFFSTADGYNMQISAIAAESSRSYTATYYGTEETQQPDTDIVVVDERNLKKYNNESYWYVKGKWTNQETMSFLGTLHIKFNFDIAPETINQRSVIVYDETNNRELRNDEYTISNSGILITQDTLGQVAPGQTRTFEAYFQFTDTGEIEPSGTDYLLSQYIYGPIQVIHIVLLLIAAIAAAAIRSDWDKYKPLVFLLVFIAAMAVLMYYGGF